MVVVGDSPPVPDPTVLTTEQLLREVDRVKELMTSEIWGLSRVIDERFSSLDRQIALVADQRVEQKSDTKAAVDAALTAQKEAVREQTTASERAIAKSEAATNKQLEQLSSTFTTAIRGVTDALVDVKERVSRIESTKVGSDNRSAQIQPWAIWIAGVLIAAITILANILTQ